MRDAALAEPLGGARSRARDISTSAAAATVLPPARRPPVHGLFGLLTHPGGAFGAGLVSLLMLLALAAPLVSPYDPLSQPSRRLLAPGGAHLLGTDEFGRDVLSRLIYGARVSLEVGVISVGIALALGGTLGLVSGYFVGWLDVIVQRLADVVLAFPTVILVIAIAGVLGPSLPTAMLAIGLVYAPNFARVVRGPTLVVAREQYVEAARTLGAGSWRIMVVHVLPNVTAPIIVQATLSFSTAILAEATLSFLGLGIQPPAASWGTMLGSGRRFMEVAPWVAVYPGLAIMAAVLAFNLLGDALRDALDPRLRKI
jgi:peptide/nickel transport system permease protein